MARKGKETEISVLFVNCKQVFIQTILTCKNFQLNNQKYNKYFKLKVSSPFTSDFNLI